MKKTFLLTALMLLALSVAASAQETYFGKNKVRYKDFDWNYIQTRHFDIYFYEDAYETAKFAATVAESAYVEISTELNYLVQRRIPVFIYNSHNDFQQTNILSSLIGEGTGGFTEAYKNRMVVPFSGSYSDFRHVLHHELTHAVVYDLIYGRALSSLISKQRLFQQPLWLAEGFAEYSSRHGWDYFSDMWVRDATINGYLYPPLYLTGYNAYREGQAMVKYIADKYGEDKIGELFKRGKVFLSMDRTIKHTLGIDMEKFWEEFSKEMKRRYWPEIAKRKEIEEVGKKLTKSREDGSYANEKPVFSAEGDVIAMFTDRWDYTEIVLISIDDGKVVDRLVKGSRSGDLESLHSYVSGISFSPDGRYLVFVAKSSGKESLFFMDLRKKKVTIKKRFDFYSIMSPAFSPNSEMVAFSALEGNKRDIFIYDMKSDEVRRITDDRYDDVDVSWFPGSTRLVFSSDRPHPDNSDPRTEPHPYVSDGALMPGDFDYGSYNLHTIDIDSREIKPLPVGPGQNVKPTVSPDGSKVAFISNRNGIDNVYITYPDSGQAVAVTDILTGIMYVSWSPNGKKLAVEAFNKGGLDIFVLKDLAPVGNNGVLEPTDFYQGRYDTYVRGKEPDQDSAVATRDSLPLDYNAVPSDLPTVDTVETISVSDTLTIDSGAVDTTLAVIDTTAALSNIAVDTTAATTETTVDSAKADSTVLASVPVDSITTASDTTTVADTTVSTSDTTATTPEVVDKGKADGTITETGIYDGEFVFVGSSSDDPLGDIMQDMDGDSTGHGMRIGQTEPASFDSIAPPNSEGDYEVKPYKVKFTPDYVGGGFAYDTFFGLRGQTVFWFSDYLGNHDIIFLTDLYNSIDQSNFQAYYYNSTKRTNFGVGLFHSKNYYIEEISDYEYLFSDRFYGIQAFARRPFSTFSRVDAVVSQYFIDREYLDIDDTRPDRNARVTTGSLEWVTDNIIWGLTGPTNGRRAKLTLTAGRNLFDTKGVEFYSAEFDYRKYIRLGQSYSFAIRMSGGYSDGMTPKTYFLGGTTNWIGNRTLDAEVYDVENLYFADVVTPLRGVDYYSLSGNRYGLMNLEFRFPLIDYFVMRFPLPLVLSRVGGALFYDMGAAIRKGEKFRFGSSSGGDHLEDVHAAFGFGMRANLGFILLRYDIAWATDYLHVAEKPQYYFSIGADF
ncbi:MAG TPA: hypothetical protein PLF13_02340 [candidate division Zixibacteria bacterium]|nr:hypothetical protein [candidate division Zixibacteria bacterium]